VARSYYTALERSQIKKLDIVFVQWFMMKYVKENELYLNKTKTNTPSPMFVGKGIGRK
jgi:hypothetical protein